MYPPKPPRDNIDRLKHFARDKAAVKLTALLIDRLPAILMAASVLVAYYLLR